MTEHASRKSAWKSVLVRFAIGLFCLPALTVLFAALIIIAHFSGTADLPADCAIVFGAAVYGQDMPGPAITRRTGAAAGLYREGQVRTLVMSGGKGRGVRESEASVMRELAIDLGVLPDDIRTEDRSHSTWENIRNTQNLTSDCSSVIGISDRYHLARIELIAARQGFALKTLPATERPSGMSERRSFLRELAAYLYYAFYLDVLYPNPSGLLDGTA